MDNANKISTDAGEMQSGVPPFEGARMCKECGRWFDPRGRSGHRIYCSPECRANNRRRSQIMRIMRRKG